jgi:hypothetical protein
MPHCGADLNPSRDRAACAATDAAQAAVPTRSHAERAPLVASRRRRAHGGRRRGRPALPVLCPAGRQAPPARSLPAPVLGRACRRPAGVRLPGGDAGRGGPGGRRRPRQAATARAGGAGPHPRRASPPGPGPPAEHWRGFLGYWTRKEAVLKQLGTVLSTPCTLSRSTRHRRRPGRPPRPRPGRRPAVDDRASTWAPPTPARSPPPAGPRPCGSPSLPATLAVL